MVGVGYQIKKNKLAIYSELLAGAAGGGGLNSKGCFILKVALGGSYSLNRKLSVYAEVSKLLSIHDNFTPVAAEFGLTYHLNLLGN